jgi:hypothetical protein
MPAFPDLTNVELYALVEHTILLGDEAATLSPEDEESEDLDEDDEDSESEDRTLSLFLDDGDAGEGMPLIVVAVIVLSGLGLVGGLGYVWMRALRGLAR